MSATHGALVCTAQVRPHPNADRLQLAQVGGFQVVVGLDTNDGDLVLFFSSELEVSAEYATANDLIARKDEVTGLNAGGYFPKNRKVRPQRFRGERSDGYIAPLSSLDFTGGDTSTLAVGDLFTEFNGVPVCEKFVSKATKAFQGPGKQRKQHPDFAKHWDTEQFGYYYTDIPVGVLVTISDKVHGTSGRTGKVLEEVQKPRTWLDRLLRRTRTSGQWVTLTGTRNVVLDGAPTAVGYYSDESFRTKASAMFQENLHLGEIVYYELVGWTGPGSPIMSPYDLKGSKDFKHLGAGFFSYGAVEGTFRIFVYRITQNVIDCCGNLFARDLAPHQVEARAAELGLSTVPVLYQAVFDGDHEGLRHVVDNLLAVEFDVIDPRHIAEGVVIRVDAPGRTYALKSKTLAFKVAEGIIKESDDSVDLEEVS